MRATFATRCSLWFTFSLVYDTPWNAEDVAPSRLELGAIRKVFYFGVIGRLIIEASHLCTVVESDSGQQNEIKGPRPAEVASRDVPLSELTHVVKSSKAFPPPGTPKVDIRLRSAGTRVVPSRSSSR